MGGGLFCIHFLWLPVDPGSGLFEMIVEVILLILIGMILYGAAARLVKSTELKALMQTFFRRGG
ncbi:MAG: hypothetical protein R6U38_07635, partial [Desulfatiglandaceae bacterium]